MAWCQLYPDVQVDDWRIWAIIRSSVLEGFLSDYRCRVSRIGSPESTGDNDKECQQAWANEQGMERCWLVRILREPGGKVRQERWGSWWCRPGFWAITAEVESIFYALSWKSNCFEVITIYPMNFIGWKNLIFLFKFEDQTWASDSVSPSLLPSYFLFPLIHWAHST